MGLVVPRPPGGAQRARKQRPAPSFGLRNESHQNTQLEPRFTVRASVAITASRALLSRIHRAASRKPTRLARYGLAATVTAAGLPSLDGSRRCVVGGWWHVAITVGKAVGPLGRGE
ncbi:Os09g0457950 [Oryza sativa Japonica Group]|uniref:Os09g0457950 protein n=1 Tax=Oryza sativa subsp. japonica TaxID=39947 RepID=A0A0P0XN65_ORYSJ|nr:Os09g0457950 [Oryza sativa Japonica Group]